MATNGLCQPCASTRSCEPCTRKELTSTAISWCCDCEEALCQDCVDAHRVIKVSSAHHVVELDNELCKPGIVNVSQQYCETHPELMFDFFCTFHDILCCHACLADVHRNCDKIIPIDVACKGVRESMVLNDLSDELNNIIASSERISSLKQKHNEKLEDQENQLKIEIANAKSDILAYVDNLEQTLMSDLKALRMTKQEELQSARDIIMDVKNEAKSLQKQISIIRASGSRRQTFVLLHKVKTCVANMDKTIESTVRRMEQPVLQFKESNNGFTFNEQLGNIQVKNISCVVSYKSPKYRFAQVLPDPKKNASDLGFENKFDVDTSPQIQITGMTATHDGKLLLCNYRNNSILAYDSNGSFIARCQLFGAPWNITSLPFDKDQAVVTLPRSSSVRFLDIRNMKPGKAVEMPGCCYGIVATNDNIYVGGIQEIYILNSTGNFLDTIKVGKTTWLWYMAFADDKLFYSDQNKVYCVDLTGQELFTYEASSLKRPMAIAIDNNENIYVAGGNSDNFHRLDINGKYIDTVLSKTNNVDRPWASCFVPNDQKLVFANNDGKTIYVFKCK